MRALVDSAIHIKRGVLSPKAEAMLERALSFPNPAYQERRRLGVSTYGVPERLCFLARTEHGLQIPRGAVSELKRVNGEVCFDDQRQRPTESLRLPSVSLRDYQAEGVKRLLRITQGTVVIPCGGGKTRVGVGAISALQTPTLILVHTLDLADQWRDRIRAQLKTEPAIVGGGEAQEGPITIAVVQTLIRWERERLDAFLCRFGLLIVDEAHHIAASTFHQIVDRCPARYRLGLTATPEREDGLTPLLKLFLGPPLLQVPHQQLVDAGVLTLPEVQLIETDFKFAYRSAEDYPALMKALASDVGRNALICERVETEARAGNLCLVLSGRVGHCHHIAQVLHERGVRAAALTSKVRKARRPELLEQARSGELQVLVATSLADEGLDLPRLSRVFLAFPSKARGRTIQRIGRLMRPHPDKEGAVLYDFVDRKVPALRRQHLARQKLYAELIRTPVSNPCPTSGSKPAFDL